MTGHVVRIERDGYAVVVIDPRISSGPEPLDLIIRKVFYTFHAGPGLTEGEDAIIDGDSMTARYIGDPVAPKN